MSNEDRRGHSWIVWNLANIVSLSRLLGVFFTLFVLELSIEKKLFIYVLWEATDAIDGIVARKIGNNRGFGMILDPVVDKLSKFFILIFFFSSRLLGSMIVGLILLGEAFVLVIAFYGAYLLIKHQVQTTRKSGRLNYRKIFLSARDRILDKWEVNLAGKIAMIFYVIMATLIFFNITILRNEIVELGYYLAFSGGFIARAVSIPIYGYSLYKAQKELF